MKTYGQTFRRRDRQGGFSLLEALVSIIIFSVGVMGLVGIQARAMEYSMDSDDRNRAALLANELASQMWTTKTTNLPPATLTTWAAKVADPTQGGLASGVGSVSLDANNVATISIAWTAPGHGSSGSRFQTQVLMP